jgi:hypothetical protein
MVVPSIFKHPFLVLRVACRHPRIFALGFSEGSGGIGMTYDDDPWSPRSFAYDAGRDLRRWGRV